MKEHAREPLIRTAREADIDQLEDIERRCFSGDKLSRRSFRRFIRSPGACMIVAENAGILGYGLVLMRRDSASARIYSIAIQPQNHKQGLGKKLIQRCEELARRGGRGRMVLEVRVDNGAAIALYEKLGYRRFGIKRNYYEDGEDALRLERELTD